MIVRTRHHRAAYALCVLMGTLMCLAVPLLNPYPAFARAAGAAAGAPSATFPLAASLPGAASHAFASATSETPHIGKPYAEKFDAEKPETEPLAVSITDLSSTVLTDRDPLTLQVKVTNNSTATAQITDVSLASSPDIFANDSELFSWFSGSVEYSIRETATLRQRLPLSVDPDTDATLTLSLAARDRHWDTSADIWGARGLEVQVESTLAATAQDGQPGEAAQTEETENAENTTQATQTEQQTLSVRTVVVAASTNTQLPKFPVSAAVVCAPSVNQLAALPGPLEALLPSDQRQSNSGAPLDAAAIELPSQETWKMWDRTGVNLFWDPVGTASAAHSVSHNPLAAQPNAAQGAPSATGSSGGSPAGNTQTSVSMSVTSPTFKRATEYLLPPYDADLAALAHAKAAELGASLSGELERTAESGKSAGDHAGNSAREGADSARKNSNEPADENTISSPTSQTTADFSVAEFVPLTGNLDAATLAFSRAHHFGIPVISAEELDWEQSFYFPDARGVIDGVSDTNNSDSTEATDGAAGANSADAIDAAAGADGTVSAENTDATAASTDGVAASYPAIIANPTVSSALSGILLAPGGAETIQLSPLNSEAVAVASSAIFYRQAPSHERSLVTLTRTSCTGDSDSAHARESAEHIAALLSVPWLSAQPLSQLPTRSDPSEWSVSPEQKVNPGELSASEIQHLTVFVRDAEALADILPADVDVTGGVTSGAYQLLATSWRDNSPARSRYAAALDIPAFLAKNVQIESSKRLNLIAEQTQIPIRVHSNVTVPIAVTPTLNIPDARLAQGARTTVSLKPDNTSTLQIPVQARGGGLITVTAQLTYDSDRALATSEPMNIWLHATWENTGTAIVGGIALLLFVIGIIHSARRGRRSQPVSNATFTKGLASAHRHLEQKSQ